jgi:hypothetical protein
MAVKEKKYNVAAMSTAKNNAPYADADDAIIMMRR